MLLVVNALMLLLTSKIAESTRPRLPRRRLLDRVLGLDRHLDRLDGARARSSQPVAAPVTRAPRCPRRRVRRTGSRSSASATSAARRWPTWCSPQLRRRRRPGHEGRGLQLRHRHLAPRRADGPAGRRTAAGGGVRRLRAPGAEVRAELARAGPRARHGRQEPRRHHRRAGSERPGADVPLLRPARRRLRGPGRPRRPRPVLRRRRGLRGRDRHRRAHLPAGSSPSSRRSTSEVLSQGRTDEFSPPRWSVLSA